MRTKYPKKKNTFFDTVNKIYRHKNGMYFIDYHTAVDFLLPKHYSGRAPQITFAFGWFENYELKAVCTFGKPASPAVCNSICGIEYSSYVYELTRLCRVDDFDRQLSQFVSYCLRALQYKNLIIISFSDTGMSHAGYIYQACNFIYTGVSKGSLEPYSETNKHSRHNKTKSNKRIVGTDKHRYIYISLLKIKN